jgi:hypothetical protein
MLDKFLKKIAEIGKRGSRRGRSREEEDTLHMFVEAFFGLHEINRHTNVFRGGS